MTEIIKRVTRDCNGCMGASFNDCGDCPKVIEMTVVQCQQCRHMAKGVTWQDKLLCNKVHRWVESTDFCAWGEAWNIVNSLDTKIDKLC